MPVEILYGLQTFTGFAFPSSDEKRLGIAVANALRDLLREGDEAMGLAGLDSEPLFVNRRGAGGGRDATTTTTATVRFFDDLPSGVPEVVIVGIEAAGERQGWGEEFEVQRCLAVLDCNTSQFHPGALSNGVDAATAGALLGNTVEAMLRCDELMTARGFTDPRVSATAPPGVMGKDGIPFEFHYPITVQFEIYLSKI